MRLFCLGLLMLAWAAGGATHVLASPPAGMPAAEARARLTVTPAHPRAGEPVTVAYRPATPGARLRRPDTLELVVRSHVPDYRIVPMKKEGARWTAQVTPGAHARFLRFYVQADSATDRHGGKAGWGRMVYGPDGRPVRGAHVARARFYHAHYADGPRRDSLMQAAYRRELARFPDQVVARAHQYALRAAQDTANAGELRRRVLKKIGAARDRYADDPERLREVQRAYHALEERGRAQSVGQRLAETAPRGPEAEMAAFRRATAEGVRLPQARRRAEAFVERFPQSFFRGGVYESLFEKYRAAGETDALLGAGRAWVRAAPANRMRALHAVARALAEAGRLDTARSYARRAVAAAAEAPVGYTLFKNAGAWQWAPTPLTPHECRAQGRRQRGEQRALLGALHYRAGNHAKAAEILAQAVAEHPAQAEAWTALARAREKAGQPDRAYAAAEQALRHAPMHSPARSLFRRLYVQRHGSDEGLQAAVARLARGTLHERRLNEPAPPLRLTALGEDETKGDSLRAAAVDGHVLVLDFWASWCGPCQAAFPHLQDAYEKYRDVPDVTFLAVHPGWNERRARARRFIQESGYTMPAYWDAGGRLARALGVRSLPTTVLIGPGGRVQFRERGFGGGAHYVDNLALRIDLLRKGGAK